MKFSLWELKMIGRLLSSRLNADYDPDADRLLDKVKKEIDNAESKNVERQERI